MNAANYLQKSTRLDMTGWGIHWELYKEMKFDNSTKWHIHQPKSVLENDMQKNLWDFEIQTDHLIPVRRTGLVMINKKKEKRTC